MPTSMATVLLSSATDAFNGVWYASSRAP